MLAAGQNRGPLKVFLLKKKLRTFPLEPLDTKAQIKYKNGKIRMEEVYYGSSFLSQSGRFFQAGDEIAEIEITNSKGVSRKIKL